MVHDDIIDRDDDGEPLTPADHGKVPGSGNTVVPVPEKQILLLFVLFKKNLLFEEFDGKIHLVL